MECKKPLTSLPATEKQPSCRNETATNTGKKLPKAKTGKQKSPNGAVLQNFLKDSYINLIIDLFNIYCQ